MNLYFLLNALTLLLASSFFEYGFACNSEDVAQTNALNVHLNPDSSLSQPKQTERSLIIGSGRNTANVFTFLPPSELPGPNDITVDMPYECLSAQHQKNYTDPHIQAFATGTKGLSSIRNGIKELLKVDEPIELFACIWFQRLGRGLLDLSQDRQRKNPLVVGGFESLGYAIVPERPLFSTKLYLMNLASLLKPGGILLYQSFRCWTQRDALRMLYDTLLDLKRDLESTADNLSEKGEPAFAEIMSLPSLEFLGGLGLQESHSLVTSRLILVYTKLLEFNPPLFGEVVVDLIEERDWAGTFEGKTTSWCGQLRAVRTAHKIPNISELN